MREPKFRGYSPEDKRWYYGYGWFEIDYTDEYLAKTGKSKRACLDSVWGSYECDLESMSQFTGVFDRGVREIYEGDICNFTPMLVENMPTFKGEVEWDKYRFAIRNLDPNKQYATPFVDLCLFGIDIAVIGNIYENKELLK